MNKHLLSIDDLGVDDVRTLFDTAAEMHDVQRRSVKKLPALRGRTVVNLFFEDSTRTRSSFEIAGKWLSADVINVSAKGSSVSKGESLRDTVLTVAAMGVDGLVIRHMASGAAQQVSQWTDAVVINAGDGMHEHPTQALLDAYTLRAAARVAGGQARRDRRRPHPQPGLPQQPAAAGQARRPGHRGGAAHADAGGRHRLVQGRRLRHLARPRRGAARGRRRDDAARAARADERRLLPQRPRVHRRLRADPRPARRCSSPTPRSATPGR